jgi:hypothetical protein
MLRKYYDALRSHEARQDRWEYKFIPVDKPLTTADLQKVLAGADQEGWSYCGSQELAEEKTGKILSHMVFKRPRARAVGDEGGIRREAAAALEAARAADKERAAVLDQLKLQDLDLAKRRAEAERAVRDAERALKMADDKAASDRAAQEAATVRAQEEAAKQRTVAEQALREAAKARELDAAKTATDRDRQKQIEDLKAKYEAVIQRLQAELKAKSVPAGGKPLPQASASDPFRSTVGQPRPDETITTIVKLHHLDGNSAAKALSKVFPDAKIVAEVSPDSIILKGPAKVVTEAREVLQNKLDIATSGKVLPAHGAEAGDKISVEKIALKNLEPAQAMKIVDKLSAGSKTKVSVMEVADNTLVLTGPANVLADLKKVLIELDQPAK